MQNMDREVGRLDKQVRPNSSHQLVPRVQLARSFQQDHEYLQGATPERHRSVAFQQKMSHAIFGSREDPSIFGWHEHGGCWLRVPFVWFEGEDTLLVLGSAHMTFDRFGRIWSA
jgi:hypothetical protein